MAPKFVTGDIVRLISGGPDMTVRGVHFDELTNKYKDNIYDCIWFENSTDGKREVHDRPFSGDELIKAEEITDDKQH
jgi:uncharacterized protein YodC (DUF2158 family)